MVQLVKCNRCDFTDEDEDLFTRILVSLPVETEEKSVSRVSDLPKKWAAKENRNNRNIVSFSGHVDCRAKQESIHSLDLCPDCTVWFNGEFDLSKAVVQE